nr:undecaprenyl-diphosphate phosphatase [Vallicoccus soli]
MIGTGQAVVLGALQGLTEFLPISSSAHLRVAGELTGWGDPGAAFTAVTQLGTETAVLLYFRKDIWRIVRTWTLSLWRRKELRRDPDARLGWWIIVGTLPIGVLGFAFRDAIEGPARNLWLISGTLIGFGLLLGVVDRLATGRRTIDQLTGRHAVGFGFAQALALVPGVSRSGGTITGGLLLGYSRAAAARYSFLLAIPAVLASGVFELRKIVDGTDPVEWQPTLVATLVAFGVGYAVIAWFLRYISSEKHSFMPFVVYRVVLGLALIALLATGTISAT